MSLAVRAEHLTERMDDPECSEAVLRRTYERFGLVNRAVACWGVVYRTLIRPELAALERAGRPARILDIGCGAGDVLLRLVAAARRDGFAVDGVGIDPDASAIAATRPAEHVRFREAFSRDLVDAGERFDVVVSNHVLHHLGDEERRGFLADSELLASGRSLHSDIRRSPAAYRAYALASPLVAAGTFIRVDGLRSIRRSFTVPELRDVLPGGWRAEAAAPHRVLAIRDA